MLELVCEGKCNPDLPALDGDLRRAERSDVGVYQGKVLAVSILSPGVVKRVRALKHTEHRPLMHDKYECVDCGTVRRF